MSANKETIAQWIREKKTALGIEFGSTRIKAVLVGEDHTPIASGDHDWENRLTDGIWTYTLEDIWTGIQDAYAKLAADVKKQYGETLHAVGGSHTGSCVALRRTHRDACFQVAAHIQEFCALCC